MGPLSIEFLLGKLGKPFTLVSQAVILALSALVYWREPVLFHPLNRMRFRTRITSKLLVMQVVGSRCLSS